MASLHHISVEATPSRGVLGIGGRPFKDHLGDILAVVPGDDAADWRSGHGHSPSNFMDSSLLDRANEVDEFDAIQPRLR
jgi:hypothetical protein